ncbi:MAG: hypothetical protein LH461_06905 [Spirochaetaceae bacterium]|nr:hypothetical protein [Spirochaetaceae bacterium]
MCDHFLVLAQARAGSPASSCRGSCPTAPATLREGSGNVDALDVLRALTREPATVEVFVAEVETAREPDHSAIRKPMEIRSAPPPSNTTLNDF